MINMEEPDVVPFVPYYADCIALTDSIPEHRTRGIKNDVELFNRRVMDEVRLYGDKISKGMRGEIELAIELGISVVPMTKETKKQLWELYPELRIDRSKAHTQLLTPTMRFRWLKSKECFKGFIHGSGYGNGDPHKLQQLFNWTATNADVWIDVPIETELL